MVEGPATVAAGLTLAALPCWVREGAVLPRGPALLWTGERPLSPLSLDVYPSAAPTASSLYEDEGDGYGYQAGAFSRTRYGLQRTASGASLTAQREGSWAPPARQVLVRVHRVDRAPTGVTLDGAALSAASSEAALLAGGAGYWWDARDLSLLAGFADAPAFRLEVAYDPALTAAAPPVLVHFEVTVPAGTPTSSLVHVASSANGWTHQPLAWVRPGELAAGDLAVPRGEYFFYKLTRGDWTTVEKWPGCVEATNRYGFGQANPARQDTVVAWADRCP